VGIAGLGGLDRSFWHAFLLFVAVVAVASIVTKAAGKMRTPQSLLDKMVSGLTFDPLDFASAGEICPDFRYGYCYIVLVCDLV